MECYTYRNGKKLTLTKKADCFVTRALPGQLSASGFANGEQVSTASTRIHVSESQLESAMFRARGIAPTHHVYRTKKYDEEFLITDRIFVTFSQGVKDDDIDALAAKYALWELTRFSEHDVLYQLSTHTGMNPVKLVVKLKENEHLIDEVEHDLNYSATPCAPIRPTDPHYQNQWHLHTHSSDPLFDQRSSSACEQAWNALGHFGDNRVVVGVTDDGCNLDHQDFDSPGKFPGWGYFNGTQLITNQTAGANPDLMYHPDHNHGTACAGVIAGEADATLTVGAAPNCRLIPIRWPSGANGSLFIGDTRLMAFLNYVADKVDVVSNSWGSSPRSNVNIMVRNKIRQLASSGGRRGKGILFLWAAGNENCPIEHSSSIDIPYTNGFERRGGQYVWVGVRTSRIFRHNLVGVPGVMYVAALASTSKRSHYSNYGKGIDICAPSSNSHSYWRGQALGLGITTVLGTGNTAVRDNFGGTSSATPLVAGVAALIISANPNLTAIEVAELLKSTASKQLDQNGYPKVLPTAYDPNPSWDVSPAPPFDSGQFDSNQWSPWFGYGRVDAAAAVTQALTMNPLKTISAQINGAISIPDNDPRGIESIMQISDSGEIQMIELRVEISHTYKGDLSVSIVSPGGTEISLHNQTGGWRDDLKATYTDADKLADFTGEPIQGDWCLKVSDRMGLDLGNLERWSLIAVVS